MQIIELKRLDREGRAVEKVPGVQITPNGLVFEKALNIEQWKEVGLWLQSCRRAQTWLDADWLMTLTGLLAGMTQIFELSSYYYYYFRIMLLLYFFPI
jgi:hypothetical protein